MMNQIVTVVMMRRRSKVCVVCCGVHEEFDKYIIYKV